MDLPIAIGILIANEEIKNEKLNQMVFLGELALDGTIRKKDNYSSERKFKRGCYSKRD